MKTRIKWYSIKILNFIGKVSIKLGFPAILVRAIFYEKDRMVYPFIRQIANESKKVNNLGTNKSVEIDSVIWTGWLQGEDEVPNLIKLCVNSMNKFSNGHPIVFISEKNIFTYLPGFPQSIFQKYKKGMIKPAHFMDVVRLCLLTTYGGLWVDPTVLLTRNVEDEWFKEDFFSFKSVPGKMHSNPAESMWCTFFLGASKNSIVFQKSLSILLEYWKKNNAVIDYFLLDYVMKYVYDSNTSVRKKVDSVTKSSTNVFGINQLLRQKYSAENMFKLEKEIESDGIFKLSYKIKFKNDSLYKFWERTSL